VAIPVGFRGSGCVCCMETDGEQRELAGIHGEVVFRADS